MQITVLFLGPARDFSGMESSILDLPECSTAGQLKVKLVERFPKLGKTLPSIRMAVNCTFAADDRVLRGGDEVALIPPVSGG